MHAPSYSRTILWTAGERGIAQCTNVLLSNELWSARILLHPLFSGLLIFVGTCTINWFCFVSLIIGTVVSGLKSTWIPGKTRQSSSQAQVEWFSRTTSTAAQGLHFLFITNTFLRRFYSISILFFPSVLVISTTESNSHGSYFVSVTWSYLWWIAWLLFQGVTNTATSEPSLQLLSKLTVFSNVSLVDPSQAAGKRSWFFIFLMFSIFLIAIENNFLGLHQSLWTLLCRKQCAAL